MKNTLNIPPSHPRFDEQILKLRPLNLETAGTFKYLCNVLYQSDGPAIFDIRGVPPHAVDQLAQQVLRDCWYSYSPRYKTALELIQKIESRLTDLLRGYRLEYQYDEPRPAPIQRPIWLQQEYDYLRVHTTLPSEKAEKNGWLYSSDIGLDHWDEESINVVRVK